MLWIGDHFFQDAKTEGWFDAILIQVRNHPRAIRTMEFADHLANYGVWNCQAPIHLLRNGAEKPTLTLT